MPVMEIQYRTKLHSLTLNDNALRERSMIRLATFICMSRNLRSLSLKNCSIDDECFNLICDRMFGLKFLSKLDMTENRLTDEAVENGLLMIMQSGIPTPLTELMLG